MSASQEGHCWVPPRAEPGWRGEETGTGLTALQGLSMLPLGRVSRSACLPSCFCGRLPQQRPWKPPSLPWRQEEPAGLGGNGLPGDTAPGPTSNSREGHQAQPEGPSCPLYSRSGHGFRPPSPCPESPSLGCHSGLSWLLWRGHVQPPLSQLVAPSCHIEAGSAPCCADPLPSTPSLAGGASIPFQFFSCTCITGTRKAYGIIYF